MYVEITSLVSPFICTWSKIMFTGVPATSASKRMMCGPGSALSQPRRH